MAKPGRLGGALVMSNFVITQSEGIFLLGVIVGILLCLKFK